MTPLRVGIDVGGTFTDVVVVDAATRAIVARVKIPTTHDAEGGVSDGIVDALRRALEAPGVDPRAIAFIAHSTTQATNALLEGDVARVGIVVLHGRFDLLARAQARIAPMQLGAGAPFAPAIAYVRFDDAAATAAAIERLVAAGAQTIVATQSFGVDRPAAERRVVALANERGIAATAGHEVATTYGLRARTRTAALNAAILPRMLRTAHVTARAVERAGIAVPLMIMRSDGGVMDVAEVARRPIATMLSGPAAGIAGALLHENVTDGIFIEVGGTSADCSVIRRGQPQMRAARVGGHRTMLRTLDVRTLAIAGGSVARFDANGRGPAALRDVGPRSAHIAGFAYASFTPAERLRDARCVFVAPLATDPQDYFALACVDGTRVALTPTCAANLLGYVPDGDFARAPGDGAAAAFALAGERFGCDGREIARAMLDRAAAILRGAVDELVNDYDLHLPDVELVGGGGGAAALVPPSAERFGLRHRIAADAEVISPLGVALALVRDVVERTIVDPSPDAILAIRREAFERVVATGAAPELVEVTVEVDARRNLVRATASGATAATARGTADVRADDATQRRAAARSLRCVSERVRARCRTGSFVVYDDGATPAAACAVDERGTVRLVCRNASVETTTVERLGRDLGRLLERATTFGDVGRALPDLYLIYGRRVADFGALASADSVVALACEEVRGLGAANEVALVAASRPA